MPNRKPSLQNKHDDRVRKEASELERAGWNVRADLAGFDKPNPVGRTGGIPDIQATKRGHTRLIEVETPDSIRRDRKQRETFRRHAGQKQNTTFKTVLTDE